MVRRRILPSFESGSPVQIESVTTNPMAPDQIENPYPIYARLRRERPVFYSPMFDLWVVTRYADIAEVERDTERFSSARSSCRSRWAAPRP